jgi:hypothetical protein
VTIKNLHTINNFHKRFPLVKTLVSFWAEAYLCLLLVLAQLPWRGWNVFSIPAAILLLWIVLQTRYRSKGAASGLVSVLAVLLAAFTLAWLSRLASDFQKAHVLNSSMLVGGLFFSLSIGASVFHLWCKYRSVAERAEGH